MIGVAGRLAAWFSTNTSFGVSSRRAFAPGLVRTGWWWGRSKAAKRLSSPPSRTLTRFGTARISGVRPHKCRDVIVN